MLNELFQTLVRISPTALMVCCAVALVYCIAIIPVCSFLKHKIEKIKTGYSNYSAVDKMILVSVAIPLGIIGWAMKLVIKTTPIFFVVWWISMFM